MINGASPLLKKAGQFKYLPSPIPCSSIKIEIDAHWSPSENPLSHQGHNNAFIDHPYLTMTLLNFNDNYNDNENIIFNHNVQI